MDLWEDLEQRVRARGVRVAERVTLLRALRAEAEDALRARRRELLDRIQKAAQRLLEEALGA